jgi:hypothetical protein
VLRGGSWNNNPDNLRSANRNDNAPDNRNNNVGCRVASTLRRRSRGVRVSGHVERATEESPGPGPERQDQRLAPNAAGEPPTRVGDGPAPPPGRSPTTPAGTFPAADGRTARDRPAAVEACRDLLKWLVPVVGKFPRSHRFTLGDRIERRGYDVLENLVRATYAPRTDKRPLLDRANLDLEVMRHEVRIALDLRVLASRQHECIARLVDAVGRQIGAWRKSLR